MDEFNINDRVSITGKSSNGTIAYIGSTWFSKGQWVGVILDEPCGRNNGSYGGVRYFHCAKSHGLFIRPSQVKKIASNNIDDAHEPAVKPDCPKLLAVHEKAVSSKGKAVNKMVSGLRRSARGSKNVGSIAEKTKESDVNVLSDIRDSPTTVTMKELERLNLLTSQKLSEIKSYIMHFDEKLQRVILENKNNKLVTDDLDE